MSCRYRIFHISSAIIFIIFVNKFANASVTKFQNKDVIFSIEKVVYEKKQIEITHEIENIGERDVCICINNNRDNYPNFKSNVNRFERKIKIELKSLIIPEGVLLEEPIFAKYRRLEPKQSNIYKMILKFPI